MTTEHACSNHRAHVKRCLTPKGEYCTVSKSLTDTLQPSETISDLGFVVVVDDVTCSAVMLKQSF